MKKILVLTLGIVVVYMLCMLIPACMNQQEKAKTATLVDSALTENSPSIPEHNGWKYDSIADEMSDKAIYFADVVSDNIEFFEFPYDGGTFAKLAIRKHPQYGTDIMFMISQGQLLCRDYNGTNYVTVRFDDNPPKRYYTNESMSGSRGILFIRNTKDFITKAKNAKKIRIQAPVYNNGNVVFIFSSDKTLVWNH